MGITSLTALGNAAYTAAAVSVPFIDSFIRRFKINFIDDERWLLLLGGLGNTLIISLMSVILGSVIGGITAFMRMSKNPVSQWISGAYVNIIRGTPSFIQVLIIYFVVFNNISLHKIFIASIAFGINSGAYIAEIFRSGIMSIDKGQTEAGRSLGFTSAQTMRFIVFPQAIKNILPVLASEFIILIKETAVVGYIGVIDLTKAATSIQSRTYDAALPLIAAAVIYFIIIKILTELFAKIEKALRKADVR